MNEKQQEAVLVDDSYYRKEELEELRHLLNESIETGGFDDYDELLAISVKMDEVVLKYMRVGK